MFHVPEKSRVTNPQHPMLRSNSTFGNNGAFYLESREPGWMLFLIASDEGGWEHVSVHARRPGEGKVTIRVPSWKEMCFVKDLFWDAEDVVIQFHPKQSEYINQHPGTLHLWRPVNKEILTPPSWMVGVVQNVTRG